MNDMDRRLAKLVDDEEHARRLINLREGAEEALASGAARLDQMHLVVGRQAKQELKQWVPTLTLSATRRAYGLPAGKQAPELWMHYLPGQVLSYRPDEALSSTLVKSLARLDGALQGAADDLTSRWRAAVARMIIGPGEGERRRNALWAGRCAVQARKQLCDPERWWDANLLRDWPDVYDFLARRVDAKVDFDNSTHKWVMPYEGFVSAVKEMAKQ